MFFEKNAQALLQADADHQNRLLALQNITVKDEPELHETEDGHYTLRYQSIFLHDPHGPIAEVAQALKAHCTLSADRIHLVLGIGLGYLIDQLVQDSPGQIALYEPDTLLLRFVLENVDLSHVFRSGRLRLFIHQADLLRHLKKQLYSNYQLDIIALRGCSYFFAAEIPELMEKLTQIEQDRIYDFRTGQFFHLQWLRQFFGNYAALATVPLADELWNLYPKKPAIIISRGPSLDKALPYLAALSASAVLIAAGSALRNLWQAGVVPDFAVFYDANGMREQLYGIPEHFLSQITFLLSPFTDACCFESPARRHLVFLSENSAHIADWLDEILQRKHHRIEGGGTVSLIAFQMAQAMGCDPILLAGQDLAFPDNQVYAGGINLQLNDAGQMALPKSDTLYAEPETLDQVEGQQGETLQTLKAYQSFIRHFQDLAAQNARSVEPVQLFNTSLGGAHINGFTLRALETFQGVFPEWIKPDLKTISESEGFVSNRQAQLMAGLDRLENCINQAVQLCEALLQGLDAAERKPTDRSGLDDNSRAVETLYQTNRQLNDFLRENPMIAHILLFEMLAFQERLNRLAGTSGESAVSALKEMLKGCQLILQVHAIPWIIEAKQSLSTMSIQNET